MAHRSTANVKPTRASLTLSAADASQLLASVRQGWADGMQPAELTVEVARLTHRSGSTSRGNVAREFAGLTTLAAAAESVEVATTAFVAIVTRLSQFSLVDGQASKEHNAAVAALTTAHPSIGKALRRPGLVAGAEAAAPHAAAALVMTLMRMAESGQCDGVALRDVLLDLQPAAPQYLRFLATDDEAILAHVLRDGHAYDVQLAMRLAQTAAAGEGLPISCEAQLLLLLSRCMTGLVHDLGAVVTSDGGVMRDARRRRSGGSGGGGGDGQSAQPSAWAQPVAAAVQALAALAGSRKQWTAKAAASALDGADTLTAYVCTPLWPADKIDVDILQAILTPLAFAGTPAEGKLDQWLQHLSSNTATVAQALPGCGVPREPEFEAAAVARLSTVLAAAIGSCHRSAARLLVDGSSPWLGCSEAVAQLLAKVGPQLVAMGDTATAATHAGRGLLPDGEHAERMLFVAAVRLARPAGLILDAAGPAGLATLQQSPCPGLLDSLTALCHVSPDVFGRAMAATPAEAYSIAGVQREAILSIRGAAAAIAAATVAVLAAAEGPGPQLPSAELLGIVCRGVSVLVGRFKQDTGFEIWLGMAATLGQQRRGPGGDRPPLKALQQAADLIPRLINAFGQAAASHFINTNLAGGLIVCMSQSMGQLAQSAGALHAVCAVCGALAALLRASPVAVLRQCTAEPLTWPVAAAGVRKALQQQPKARRQLCEKALQEVESALQQAQQPTDQAVGGGGDGGDGGANWAIPTRTHASAEAAMRSLLAEEEAAAPKPSKAAQKRPRKRAATSAASAPNSVAAAPALRAEGPPAAGPPAPATAADLAAAAAAPETAGAAANRSSASTDDDATPDCNAGADAMLQQQTSIDSTEQLGRSDAADAAGSLGGLRLAGSAPEGDDQWMLCPISKVIMVDPVICIGDGQTYDRRAITAWLETHAASPVSGQPLASRDLIPNFALRSIIQAVHGGC